MNIIGLDVGTTSISGVLYSKDKKQNLKVCTRSNSFIASSEGEYIQDPSDILLKVLNIIDTLKDFSDDSILGISISTQMHGILYVDTNGQAVSPLYTWQNQRGLNKKNDENLETYLTNILGYPVYSGYGIVTHISLYDEESIPLTAEKFCTIGDYISMQLVNNSTPITDITLAHSMGICDLNTGKLAVGLNSLNKEVLRYLPEISSDIRILGQYKTIPVIQPLGDNQASFIGSVKDMNTSILLNYGTSGQVSLYSKKNEKFPGFETRSLGRDEGYIHVAFSLCGGNSYSILCEFFNDVVSLVTDKKDYDFMEIMNSLDLDISKESMKCNPYFLGRRGMVDSYASFYQITKSNFTPQNMVKSLVVGMANELYESYESIPKPIQDRISVLVGSENGVRKNNHLKMALELKYNKPLRLINSFEESCLGAIIHTCKALEIYKDYREESFDLVKYS